jgi:tyrosinase
MGCSLWRSLHRIRYVSSNPIPNRIFLAAFDSNLIVCMTGDPAGDFYISPGDPVFWLHHGMIDRVWWIWQLQNLEKRLTDVSKTLTMNNSPPSRNGTINDLTNLGVLAGDVKLADLMLTIGGMGGKLCYVYV